MGSGIGNARSRGLMVKVDTVASSTYGHGQAETP